MNRVFAKTALGLLSLLAAGCFVSACGQGGERPAPALPQVTVAQPEVRDVTEYHEYTGTTEAFEAVELRARVQGFLQSIKFEAGAMVKKDQLLFVIDPAAYQAAVQQAEAEVARAQAQRRLAQATLVRKERAFKDHAVSEVDVIQAKAELAQADAAIKAAGALLDTANINLSYTEVRSPIDGKVGRSLVDVGNLVGQGEATLLTSVMDHDPVYAYFNVSERVLLRFFELRANGQAPAKHEKRPPLYLAVATDKGYPHKGEVDFLDNKVDPATGTIGARGVFPNPADRLLPGLFVRLRMPIGMLKDALLVPDRVVGSDQRGSYLLVVDETDTVVYKPVKPGVLLDGKRVILEGLKKEDRVIVKGLIRSRPGIKVQPVKEGQEAKPAEPGKPAADTPPKKSES